MKCNQDCDHGYTCDCCVPKVPVHIDWMLIIGLGMWILLALFGILDAMGVL